MTTRPTSPETWYLATISLLLGTAIPGLWAILLATGQVVELSQRRRDVLFHIAAEVAAGAALIASGVAVIATPEAS